MWRTVVITAVALVLWIAWCVLVITELVPRIRRHLTMWNWFMAWVLCLVPVVLVAAIVLLRLRNQPEPKDSPSRLRSFENL